MTAKHAIKARCRDCLAGAKACAFDDCALKGLADNASGARRATAIRAYCRWCMNGTPVNQCASPGCAIYQYRNTAADGNLKVAFFPVSRLIVHGSSPSESKKAKLYGRGEQ